jgi:hypothetical protein
MKKNNLKLFFEWMVKVYKYVKGGTFTPPTYCKFKKSSSKNYLHYIENAIEIYGISLNDFLRLKKASMIDLFIERLSSSYKFQKLSKKEQSDIKSALALYAEYLSR